jgi:hypothetical protein
LLSWYQASSVEGRRIIESSRKTARKEKDAEAENENTMAASMCNARVFSYSTHKKHHDPPHNHKRKEKEQLVKTGSRKQKRNSWKRQAGM